MNPEPIKLTPCRLWRLLNVLHGFAIASWTPNYGHTACIPCGMWPTDSHINDGFIDQHLFTADRRTIEILLRKRAKEYVSAFLRDRLVALAAYIFPFQ